MFNNKSCSISESRLSNVSVELLDGQILDVRINPKSALVGDLFKMVCDHLSLKEFDIFGLAERIKDEIKESEYHFLPNHAKLHKHLRSFSTYSWTAKPSVSTFYTNRNLNKKVDLLASTNSFIKQSDFSNNAIRLYFKCKFYVNDPLLLTQQETRYLYYLQLKQNYLTMNTKLNEELYFLYGSLALMGDFGADLTDDYQIDNYFPKWVTHKYGHKYVRDNLKRLHKQQCQLVKTQKNAQMKFCLDLCSPSNSFNFNLYSVFKSKSEMPNSIALAIGPHGLAIYDLKHHQSNEEMNMLTLFEWNSIQKLNVDKKKFEVYMANNHGKSSIIYKYYGINQKHCKYILNLCRETHEFTMSSFTRLLLEHENHKGALSNYLFESQNALVYSINGAKETAETDTNYLDRRDNYEEREIREEEKTVYIQKSSSFGSSSISATSSNLNNDELNELLAAKMDQSTPKSMLEKASLLMSSNEEEEEEEEDDDDEIEDNKSTSAKREPQTNYSNCARLDHDYENLLVFDNYYYELNRSKSTVEPEPASHFQDRPINNNNNNNNNSNSNNYNREEKLLVSNESLEQIRRNEHHLSRSLPILNKFK